jgi:phosphatidylserine/phosphatidylglycerophosphate/cardiolipin synthase-like enzyme
MLTLDRIAQPMLKLVFDKDIYHEVIQDSLPKARKFLWIGTADIKDMYVARAGKMVPLLAVIADLIKNKVDVRLIHAKEPGPAFREDFDRYPILFGGLERVLCPRVHFKMVIIDGKLAYSGSANLTGAGMGAKNEKNRNFENGFITDDAEIIGQLIEQFDSVWRGDHCRQCGRKQYCGDCPLD